MAQFTNRATVSYSGGEAASNIVTGEITQALSVTKTAAQECYRQGELITYAVGLRNTGSALLGGLTLTDNLGEYAFGEGMLVPLAYAGSVLYYVNGVLRPAPTVTAGPPLVITGIEVPAGGDAVIVYRAKVGETAPLGAEAAVTNSVSVTGGGLLTPVTAEETLAACPEAALSIVKALNPVSVTENGSLTYTFTISNNGAAAADEATGIVFSDVFDPKLGNIAVTLNGAAWPAPDNYTYNEATGAFSTVPGKITVPAATFTQNPATGAWSITPGVTVLEISGTI